MLPKPIDGPIFILWKDDEIIGWVNTMNAYQALCLAFHRPESERYKAISWTCCKVSEQQDALDEGRILGKVIDGCDCIESKNLRHENSRLVRLLDEASLELTVLKSRLDAFQKQGENNVRKEKRSR